MAAISFTSSDGKNPEDSLLDFVRSLAPSQDKMRAAATDEANRIQERTRQGVGYDNSSFAPYSENYAKRREQLGLGSSPVTLTRSGEMLDSLEVDVSDDTISIGVSGDASVYAEAHNEGTSRLPKRRWLDASDQDLETIGNAVLPDA